MKTVTLTLEIADEADAETLDGVAVSISADIPREVVYRLILAGLDSIVQQDLLEQEHEENPWRFDEFAAEKAALASRLLLIETVLHLPTEQGVSQPGT